MNLHENSPFTEEELIAAALRELGHKLPPGFCHPLLGTPVEEKPSIGSKIQPFCGKLLQREMEARGLTVTDLACGIQVSPSTIRSLLKSKSRMEPKLAEKLASYFATSPDFWLSHNDH